MQLCVSKMPVMCMCECVCVWIWEKEMHVSTSIAIQYSIDAWHQQYLSSIAMHFIYIEWYRLSWTKKKEKKTHDWVWLYVLRFKYFYCSRLLKFMISNSIANNNNNKSVLWNLKVSRQIFSIKQGKTMSLLMVWMRKTKDFSPPALNKIRKKNTQIFNRSSWRITCFCAHEINFNIFSTINIHVFCRCFCCCFDYPNYWR